MKKMKRNRKEINKTIHACMGILLQSLGIKYRSKKHSYILTLLDLDMWLISLGGLFDSLVQ
jgi:hypothetical protein